MLGKIWDWLKVRTYLLWLIVGTIVGITLTVIFRRRTSPRVTEIIQATKERYEQAKKDIEDERAAQLAANPFRK